VVARALPRPPARVVDIGAGTGFLSLVAARLGHRVTAVDLSARMLDQLARKAAAEGLPITCWHRAADELDAGDQPFDAVLSRHLLWTLPDPQRALAAWRAAAPDGTLAIFDSAWGAAAGPAERLRARGRRLLRSLRGGRPDHHAPYDEAMQARLPYPTGIPLPTLLGMVGEAGWPGPHLERLVDLERAAGAALPWPERAFGVPPRYLVGAGRPPG
jgi:SAM-dependent methyltransferase